MRFLAGLPSGGGGGAVTLPAWLILAVALPLFAAQLLMGTDPAFAVLVLLFVCLTGVTVNIAGGLRSVTGVLFGLVGIKLLIAAQFIKIWFGQPAHTGLKEPIITMQMMLVGMAALLTIAVAMRVLPLPRRGLLRPVHAPHMLLSIGLTALAVATVAFAIDRIGGDQVGGIYGAARTAFAPAFNLAMIAVTAHAIVTTNRQRTFTLLVGSVLVFETVLGLLSFTKQAAFEPVVAYFVTCFAFRYRLRPMQIAGALVFVVIAMKFIAPVMTYVRDPDLSMAQRVELIQETVADLLRSDRILEEQDRWAADFMRDVMYEPYYLTPEPFLDRYTPMHVDMVAAGVESRGTIGWDTLIHGFKMLPPRFLYPDKPEYQSQTVIRFHIDRRAPFNPTQFSFPIFADGYASFGFLGAYLFTAVFVGILALEIKLLADRLTDNIWATLFLVLLHHPFPESNANILMLLATHGMLVIVAFVLTVRWAARYNLGPLKAFRRRSPPRGPAVAVGLTAARAQHHPAGE